METLFKAANVETVREHAQSHGEPQESNDTSIQQAGMENNAIENMSPLLNVSQPGVESDPIIGVRRQFKSTDSEISRNPATTETFYSSPHMERSTPRYDPGSEIGPNDASFSHAIIAVPGNVSSLENVRFSPSTLGRIDNIKLMLLTIKPDWEYHGESFLR